MDSSNLRLEEINDSVSLIRCVCVCVKVGKNKRNEDLDGLESEATSGSEL